MPIERPDINATNHLIKTGLILKVIPDNGTIVTVIDALGSGQMSLGANRDTIWLLTGVTKLEPVQHDLKFPK